MDVSICPEQNSTDCLFRELLRFLGENRKEDDEKTDWDPINFVFTAVIGVVASVFAFTTIMQAVLTAGKGRRKTSARAIGTWAKATETRWVSSETAFHFTAKTPMLLSKYLLPWIDEELERRQQLPEKHDNGDTMMGWLRRAWVTWSNKRPTQAPAAATWLEFFNKVGLKDLQTWDNKIRPLKLVAADYLPDDVVAAPAYLEVQTIVAMAAAAGADRWILEKESKYPIISSDNFQFDFRQHPMLGTIGAFSWIGLQKEDYANPGDPDLKKLKWALHHSEGFVSVKEWCPVKYKERRIRPGIYARDRKSPGQLRRFPDNPMINLIGGAEQVVGGDLYRHFSGPDCFLPNYDFLSEHYVLIGGLLMATTPKWLPDLFPSSKLSVDKSLSFIALNGVYWSKTTLERFRVSSLEKWPALRRLPNWFELPWSGAKSHTEKEKKTVSENFPKVLQLCLGLLHDPEYFHTEFQKAPREDRIYLRELAFKQLGILDEWLKNEAEPYIEERTMLLCDTALVLSRAEQVLQEKKLNHSGLPLASRGGDKKRRPDETVTHRHVETLKTLSRVLDDFHLDKSSFEAFLDFPMNAGWHLQGRANDRIDDFLDAFRDQMSRTRSRTRERSDSQIQEISRISETVENSDFAKQLKDHHDLIRLLTGHWVDVPSAFFNIHRMLSRLKNIIGGLELKDDAEASAAKSAEETSNGRDVQTTSFGQTWRTEDLDDMLIYRCLTICVLFITAPDTSQLMDEQAWSRVIPII